MILETFSIPTKKASLFSIKECTIKSIDIIKYYEKEGIKINLKCDEDIEILGYQNEFSQFY